MAFKLIKTMLERNPANPKGRTIDNPNGYIIGQETYKLKQDILNDQTMYDKIEMAFEHRAFSRTILSGLVVGFVILIARAMFGI